MTGPRPVPAEPTILQRALARLRSRESGVDSVPTPDGRWQASPGLRDTLEWISGEDPVVRYEPYRRPAAFGYTTPEGGQVVMNTHPDIESHYRLAPPDEGDGRPGTPEDVLAHEYGHVTGINDPSRVKWSRGRMGEGDRSETYARAFARAMRHYRGLAPADTSRAYIYDGELSSALERGQAEDPDVSWLGRAIYSLTGTTPDWSLPKAGSRRR